MHCAAYRTTAASSAISTTWAGGPRRPPRPGARSRRHDVGKHAGRHHHVERYEQVGDCPPVATGMRNGSAATAKTGHQARAAGEDRREPHQRSTPAPAAAITVVGSSRTGAELLGVPDLAHQQHRREHQREQRRERAGALAGEHEHARGRERGEHHAAPP